MRIQKISPDHKLIVLHTPKCGGSSLRASILEAFGRTAVYRDYEPIGSERMPRRLEIPEAVIYGHFRATKYEDLQGFWVTLLREPVDRMLSLYFNWRFSPPETLQNPVSRLRNLVYSGKVSLLGLARKRAIAGRIDKFYFGGFDMTRFDLIISHHNYRSGIRRLGEMVEKPLAVHERNLSSSRSLEYEKARGEVMADQKMMSALKELISDEIAFYERCIELPSVWRD